MLENPSTTSRSFWQPLTVVFLAVITLGFYAVTDTQLIASDPLLNGGDLAASAICHRIAERSFMIFGRPMPLCARCSGIYLGILLTFALTGLAGRLRHAALPPLRLLLILLTFIGIMGIDGLNSYSHFFPQLPHLYQPHNWLRLATGLGTGLAIGTIVFPSLAQVLWIDARWMPSLANFRELGLLVALAITLALLILSNQPLILYVLAVGSVIGILLIFTSINTLFLMIALRWEGRFRQWRQASGVLALGLLLTLVELTAAAWLRWTLFGTISGLPGI